MIEATNEYSILLSGLTAEHNREGLLSTYENVMKVTSLKLFQYFEEKENVVTRLALFQVQDAEEACRAAIRYNQNIKSSLHVTKLSKDSKAVSSMSDMLTLILSFNSSDRDLNVALLALLRSFGEIRVTSMESCNGANLWVFKVKPSYSIHPVCTGEVFQFRGVEIHAKYEDLEMSAYYFKEMGFELTEMHKKINVEEGLEIILDSVLIRGKPKSRDSTNPGSQRAISLSGSLVEDFDDCLEDIYEEDSESLDEYEGPRSSTVEGLSFFGEKQNTLFALKYTPTCTRAPQEDKVGSLQAVPKKEQTAKPDYQRKISTLKQEIIKHSGELKEAILEEIEMKIDPSLPLEERRKIEAMILKTKLRKSKRKERKKEERAQIGSQECLSPKLPPPAIYLQPPPQPSPFAYQRPPGPPPFSCQSLSSGTPLHLRPLTVHEYRVLTEPQQPFFHTKTAPQSSNSLNCKDWPETAIEKPPIGCSRTKPKGITPFTNNQHGFNGSKTRYPHADIYPT